MPQSLSRITLHIVFSTKTMTTDTCGINVGTWDAAGGYGSALQADAMISEFPGRRFACHWAGMSEPIGLSELGSLQSISQRLDPLRAQREIGQERMCRRANYPGDPKRLRG